MHTKELLSMTVVGAVLLILGVILVFPLGYGIIGSVLMGGGLVLLVAGVGLWVYDGLSHRGSEALRH